MKLHSNKPTFAKDGIFSYDIDTVSGQSGSPVYEEKDSSKLVGIHKGHSPNEKLNIAVMITGEMISTLEKWAVEMGVIFDVANPSVKGVGTGVEESKLKIIQLTTKLEQVTKEKENLQQKLDENGQLLNKVMDES